MEDCCKVKSFKGWNSGGSNLYLVVRTVLEMWYGLAENFVFHSQHHSYMDDVWKKGFPQYLVHHFHSSSD